MILTYGQGNHRTRKVCDGGILLTAASWQLSWDHHNLFHFVSGSSHYPFRPLIPVAAHPLQPLHDLVVLLYMSEKLGGGGVKPGNEAQFSH